ncbi:MFS transporter [Salmonella enterica]|uniref:MFS transporter n=4 Tax=Salmonella enterica TaxID=28901 RepID=A0A708CFX3_SALTM|nr:MFS transporter [Salmonella enterica subsp. enterica serovar Cardoner]EBW3658530.1 MFS transporter [Salmonella enterica subsp. enterica serovar Agama]ECB1782348.1 MFS transporter [Salmonella enterica subsp. enterica serovar Kibi]ECC3419716.1 MFS transporter [Salmonella enterica subsp. enterica]EEF7033007.1 MFS transporter [Salmonella enterica]EFX3899682.1 MFS transporter [Salmonella enterica subsp. enterica serovar Ank]EHN2720335.1 MFS transporter [Salmonella enterica subsp. enterica serov
MPLALFALTISAFAIGTTEFVIVGLVPTIAQQLAISLPSAGMLVSIYALGVAIGAPVLTALTGRLPRKQLLVALMVLFTAGNLLAWQAPGYMTLIVARLLTGLAHGVFFSIGSTIATSLVPKEKAASAIAIMFGGLTVALVTGVPLGTFIGQHFGWRETFLAVSLLGVIALISSQLLIPANIPGRAAASIRDQVKVLTHPRLLLIYAVTALGYGGVFTAFTFLAPMMQDLAGFSPSSVSWILLGYGVSVAIGNIWGGKLADKHGAVPALKFIFAALFVLLMVFQVTASTQYAALATILVMGVFAFGNVPGLQVYVVQKAEQFTPNAVDVASGLNIAAFNIGIALGSVIGGQTVAHYGLAQTPWIGALIVLVAFLLMGVSGRLDKPVRIALE